MSEETKTENTPTAEPAKEVPMQGDAPKPEAKPEEAKPAEQGEKPAEAPKAEEPKKDEPKQEPKKVAPEKYDLKLPDGSALEPDIVKKIEQVAREQGLSQEEAQAFLQQKSDEVSSFVKERSEAWYQQALSDPEIGGDKLGRHAEASKRLIAKYGDEDLKAVMDKTGYGNHPSVIKFLSRIVEKEGLVFDDEMVRAPNAPAPAKTREELYYPKQG